MPGRRLWLLSFHNFISTYYAPLLFRPLAYLRGLRNLFGGSGWVCIVLCGGQACLQLLQQQAWEAADSV